MEDTVIQKSTGTTKQQKKSQTTKLEVESKNSSQNKIVKIQIDVTTIIEDKIPLSAGKSDSKVFMIFVVDTSNSMKRWLRRANHTFQGFAEALSPLQWTAMFTKADGGSLVQTKGRAIYLEKDGVLLQKKYLSQDVKDYKSIFLDTLRLHGYLEYFIGDGADMLECDIAPGCQWGWNEKPLEALKLSLLNNKNQIEKADIVTAVIISDSDEGVHYTDEKRVKASDVISVFKGNYSKKKLITYGIIMLPNDSDCLKQWHWTSENTYGERIAKMAEKTGGINVSLCEEDFTPLAYKMVSDIRKIQ